MQELSGAFRLSGCAETVCVCVCVKREQQVQACIVRGHGCFAILPKASTSSTQLWLVLLLSVGLKQAPCAV